MDLNNKVVLLTGGKRIGAEVAKAVCARGADVALTFNRSKKETDETAAAIRGAGRRALVVQADVSKEQACLDLANAVDREFGRLDVLVNMASLYEDVPFEALTAADWRRRV